MKKVLLTLVLVVASIQYSNAQISYGLKTGLNIDLNGQASEYIKLPNGLSIESASNNGGYHFGAWFRVKVPLIGLYVRPEVIYTSLSSEHTIRATTSILDDVDALVGKKSTSINYSLNKIDIPVLLGLKFLAVGNIFVGPNIQYLTKSEIKSDFYNNETIDEAISFGLIIGAGIEFWKLGIDARFETGFASPDTFTSGPITSGNVENILGDVADVLGGQKPSQLIIGLSYKF